jgi:E3 ubiquitin-protein ligase synoviolin
MPFASVLLRVGSNELARFLNSHRVFFYTLVSLVSVSAVITNALKNYSNFYSVAIYLSKSSRSVLVLANFGVLLALLCGHIVQRIFFGPLRANEVERLYDRLWFFITESLLAFTIFRDEFDTPFALMFGFLLFVKSFHWLASDRIEWMDQRPYPGPPLLFHVRMVVLFTLLWATDLLMFLFAVEHTLTAGVGGMVLFASEYGILMASLMNTMSKYVLSTYDLRRAGRRGGENAPPWENKSMWVFYIELATDFLKLTTYLIFFIIIITFYGLPLNIIRDVYITARSFVTRLRALHRYQTATRNMDQRYPNASEEELTAMSDRTCIICREEMISPNAQDSPAQAEGPNTTPKKLPCGHIFHFHCLRSWLERQQSCPTCRRNVLDPTTPATPPQVPNAAPGQPGNLDNAGAQANPGNLPNGPGNNNGLGFMDRFFGPPLAPQNLAPNRLPGQQNGAGNQQGQAGAGGIYINYQVQYQFPRGQNGGVAPGELAERLPVPPYPGFPGPEGVWQPWPAADGVNHAVDVPAYEPRVTGAQGNSGDVQASTSTSTVTSTTSTSSSTSTDSTASTDSSTSESASETAAGEPSPREAAALAALRRFGGSSAASPRGPATLTPTAATDRPTSVSHSSTLNPGSPSVSSSTTTTTSTLAPSTSTPTASTGSTSTSPNRNGIQPPKFIPLFDIPSPFASPAGTPRLGNGTNEFNSAFSSPFTSALNRMNRPSTLDPNYVPTGPLPRREPEEDFARERQPHLSRRLPSQLPSHLPPTLTNEQLAHLDVLTRESIDERLRILEGVSGAVYRCIDDLMRLRSALPPLDGPVAGSASSASHGVAESSSSSATKESTVSTNGDGTSNGKEKQKATVEDFPESEAANSFQ